MTVVRVVATVDDYRPTRSEVAGLMRSKGSASVPRIRRKTFCRGGPEASQRCLARRSVQRSFPDLRFVYKTEVIRRFK
jgi:hypothetical protein